jgi:hypothetical protein
MPDTTPGEQVLRAVASGLEALAKSLEGIEDSVSAPDFPASEQPDVGLVNFRESILAMAAEAERFAEDYVFADIPDYVKSTEVTVIPDPHYSSEWRRGYAAQLEFLADKTVDEARLALSGRIATQHDNPYNTGATQATHDFIASPDSDEEIAND